MKPPHLPHHAHQPHHTPPVTPPRLSAAHAAPVPHSRYGLRGPNSRHARLARFVGRNWARVGYGYRVEPTWLEVNRFAMPVRDLSPAFEGLKVAHLTDFHCGGHIPAGYIEGVIERTVAEKPDVIALTGDFVHKGYKHVAHAAKLFRGLTAPLGVFAVLGNHDFSVRNALGIRRHRGLHKAVADALAGEGVRVLRNESVSFERDGSKLLVAGVDDLWSCESDPAAALAGVCPNTPRVVLAHNPQSVDQFDDHRFDLLLSGHTHGGQIDWPGMGRVLLGKKAKRWAAGLYPHGGASVYVNKGVGFGWRFRFGVRPELAVFTLTSNGAGVSHTQNPREPSE
ncbi:MAG TPA: metallophosphoesterase [Gemmataceae bacterium]|nr:metallophosphoesterase [Gemmataceae bacterium]